MFDLSVPITWKEIALTAVVVWLAMGVSYWALKRK